MKSQATILNNQRHTKMKVYLRLTKHRLRLAKLIKFTDLCFYKKYFGSTSQKLKLRSNQHKSTLKFKRLFDQNEGDAEETLMFIMFQIDNSKKEYKQTDLKKIIREAEGRFIETFTFAEKKCMNQRRHPSPLLLTLADRVRINKTIKCLQLIQQQCSNTRQMEINCLELENAVLSNNIEEFKKKLDNKPSKQKPCDTERKKQVNQIDTDTVQEEKMEL